MDEQSQVGARLLDSLADLHLELSEVGHRFRKDPRFEHVVVGFDLRRYPVDPPRRCVYLEAYVDASLHNRKGILWQVDLTWDAASWLIEANVGFNNLDGQGVQEIIELPARKYSKLNELLPALHEMAQELLATYDTPQVQQLLDLPAQ